MYAVVCGAILGIERRLKHKHVGLKTMIMISVGSSLFIDCVSLITNNTDSISRIIAQIITGIGFLGAGVIIKDANDKISGLTTAALVWVSSALGVLCGTGHGLDAVEVTLLITTLVVGITFIENKLFPK